MIVEDEEDGYTQYDVSYFATSALSNKSYVPIQNKRIILKTK